MCHEVIRKAWNYYEKGTIVGVSQLLHHYFRVHLD